MEVLLINYQQNRQMSTRLYLTQPQDIASQPRINSNECPQYSQAASLSIASQRAETTEIKRMRKQYEIRLIELQNEVNFLKEEVNFIKETHQRELVNVKAVMEYEYTTKMRAFKVSLREEFARELNQNNILTNMNKHMEEELRLMKLKFERADKYCKELEETNKIKLDTESREIEELKKISTSSLNALRKELTKDHQIQVNFMKSSFEKQKAILNDDLKKMEISKSSLEEQVSRLKSELTKNMVQKEQIKIQRDKQIRELSARVEVLRETSVLDEVVAKRKVRQSKLTEVSTNYQQNFDRKKMYETIEVLGSNNSKNQSAIDREMIKLWQTQVVASKSQIRKVNTKKNCKRTSTSISTYERQASIPDSPRFGTEAPSKSKCSLFFD